MKPYGITMKDDYWSSWPTKYDVATKRVNRPRKKLRDRPRKKKARQLNKQFINNEEELHN